MTRSTLTPVIGILDDADAPEARMLVVVFGSDAAPTVEYVSPHLFSLAARRRARGMPPGFVPLSLFGVAAAFTPEGDLRLTKVAESAATYPDGLPRPWQDRTSGIVRIRSHLAGPVLKAVRNLQREAAAPGKRAAA